MLTALVVVALAGDPQADWIKDHAIVFDAVEAGHGFDDLAGLEAMIGDARIVALGEGTHGTREFFRMKHRVTEFLATKMGFEIFSIEANMPESYRINDYVLGGDGNPTELIGGMYFWTWNTEEVLDMVEWMRGFNASGAGRLQFTGFDMQTPDVAMEIVADFVLEADPERHAGIVEVYDRAKNVRFNRGRGFGVATGTFPLELALGKTVTYSGSIKTADLIDGRAGLWWRVDGPDGVLAFDNMQDRGPTGTRDWGRYRIELEVPEHAVNISFGVLMPGDGTAWFDDLAIELDGAKFVDPVRFDLDFEGEELRGLTGFPGKYFVGHDVGDATSGKQCLRIMRIPHAAKEPAGADPELASRETHDIVQTLWDNRQRYAETTEPEDVEWAIQNARVVHQAMAMRAANQGGVARDESMAANVKWILDHDPDAKIVLWAHNGHIGRKRGAMGRFLDETYGDDYLPVGFATHDGKYFAVGDGGLGVHDLALPPARSIEAVLHDADVARCILDVRAADPDNRASSWLCEPRQFRRIGAMAMDHQFGTANMQELFDLLIYVRHTTAAVQLGRKPTRPE